MRLRDFIGRSLGRLTHSALIPGRQALSRSLKEGLAYRRYFGDLSADEQQRQLLKSLQATVHAARQNVPYYADKLRGLPADFPRSLADYRELAPLDKAEVRERAGDLLAQQVDPSELVACATSGSTGEPTVVYSSQQDIGWRLSGERFYYSLLGCPIGTRVGKLYGGEADESTGSGIYSQLKNWAFNRLNYDCLRLDDEYLLRVHRGFSDFQPDIVIAYASAIYLLALMLERKGVRPDYPRRVILTAAEKLENYQRAVVERVFAVSVVERYGSRDIGQMAYQLPDQKQGFQVDRSYCLLEPEGEPDGNGIAPLLVTTLRNQAMPLLRYRIGDLARFPDSWLSGAAISSIEEIVGRTCDYILLPGDKKISGGLMDILFQDKDVKAYQVIQQANTNVEVRIVPGPRLSLEERQQVQRIVCQNLPGLDVSFEYLNEIERSSQHAKLRPVISYLEVKPDSANQNSVCLP